MGDHHQPHTANCRECAIWQSHLWLSAGYLPANHGLLTFHLGDEPFTVISQAPLHAPPSELINNDLANPANTYQAAMLHKQGIGPAMEMDSYTAAAQLALGGMLPALVPRSIVNTQKLSPNTALILLN